MSNLINNNDPSKQHHYIQDDQMKDFSKEIYNLNFNGIFDPDGVKKGCKTGSTNTIDNLSYLYDKKIEYSFFSHFEEKISNILFRKINSNNFDQKKYKDLKLIEDFFYFYLFRDPRFYLLIKDKIEKNINNINIINKENLFITCKNVVLGFLKTRNHNEYKELYIIKSTNKFIIPSSLIIMGSNTSSICGKKSKKLLQNMSKTHPAYIQNFNFIFVPINDSYGILMTSKKELRKLGLKKSKTSSYIKSGDFFIDKLYKAIAFNSINQSNVWNAYTFIGKKESLSKFQEIIKNQLEIFYEENKKYYKDKDNINEWIDLIKIDLSYEKLYSLDFGFIDGIKNGNYEINVLNSVLLHLYFENYKRTTFYKTIFKLQAAPIFSIKDF